MDLISREKVRRLICENNDKYGYSDRFHEFTDEVLNNLPSAFEGMTNGEVIQALFPNISVYQHGSTYSVNNEYNFNSTWWNLPYKAESEETE